MFSAGQPSYAPSLMNSSGSANKRAPRKKGGVSRSLIPCSFHSPPFLLVDLLVHFFHSPPFPLFSFFLISFMIDHNRLLNTIIVNLWSACNSLHPQLSGMGGAKKTTRNISEIEHSVEAKVAEKEANTEQQSKLDRQSTMLVLAMWWKPFSLDLFRCYRVKRCD